MTEREALKLALEALEKNDHRFELDRYEKGGPTRSVGKIAITAIREALAQPDENDALLAANKDLKVHFDVLMADYKKLSELCTNQGIRLMEAEDDLAQPEYNTTSYPCLMENAQGDLERINLVQTGVGIGQPAQQQEPVASGEPLPCPFCGHTGLDFSDGSTYRWGHASCGGCGAKCGEVRREYPDKGEWHSEAIAEWNRRYTTPQPAVPERKPLTYEEIMEIHEPFMGKIEFARAIEAAHGIKE